MTTEEDIEKIKEITDEAEKPKIECLFCIDRNRHNFWHFTEVTDPFIKECFAKDGITECNHDEMNESSIWFADFMAGSLLHYVFDDYLERQTDVEFLNKTVRNGTIMIPAMEKRMKMQFEEFPLEKFNEPTRSLIKEKYNHYPKFIELAKNMYEKELEFR